MSKEKKCTRCHKVLPFESFTLYSRSGKRRPKPACKACSTKLTREWQLQNLTRYKKYQRKYKSTHPSKYWEYLLKNPDKLEERRKYQRDRYREKKPLNKK